MLKLIKMIEQKDKSLPISGRIFGSTIIATVGTLGVMIALDIHKQAERLETATPLELICEGYRITRLQLGHNLLKIEGFNKWPTASPIELAQRGKERVERECGPIVKFEDLGPSSEELRRIFYAEVSDPNACFPKQ